jgi:hypothetical protein
MLGYDRELKVFYGHGYWYCHLQREFRPYPIEINSQIERAYQEFIDGGSSKSGRFLLPMGTYSIDFCQWLQIASDDSTRYRAVRRIGLRNLIHESTYLATPIPLTFREIILVGGHPENYLSSQELSENLVEGQGKPGFFPPEISAAGIARDSLYQSRV